MKEALMGLETEYGIYCDSDQIRDIFGDVQGHTVFILYQVPKVLPPENYVRNGIQSGEFWTRAGMRCYADRLDHIEVATGECSTFRDLIFQKNAGDRLAQMLVSAARAELRVDPYRYSGPFEAVANNTARRYASPFDAEDSEVTYGRHENYLLRRDLFPGIHSHTERYEHILSHAGVFFAARPVLGGSGHINPSGTFLLSPRMDWIKDLVSGATTSARSLINNRDEPHADPEKFFRYHHIAGDTNITDEICRMKIAFSYWVLRLLERGWTAPARLQLERRSYLALARAINRDPLLKNRHQLGRSRFSAAEILEIYLDAVNNNRERILFDEEDEEIFKEVELFLERAEKGHEALVGESEWATKHFLISAEAGKRGLESLDHPLLRMMSIALHNLNQNPEENPFVLIRNRVLPPNGDVGPLEEATARAPKTRALVRGLAVFLANKFRVPISFPSGSEWAMISIPGTIEFESFPFFRLNQKTPWEVSLSDVKELVSRMRPLFLSQSVNSRPQP